MVLLTEQNIRARSDVRTTEITLVESLSLCGIKSSEKDKISHLGQSLKHFIRLKKLDLSYNKLRTLEGIELAFNLRKLNLYFNSIQTWEEVNRLKFGNPQLEDLDLRLNPLSEEAQYRFKVIRAVPSLKVLGMDTK